MKLTHTELTSEINIGNWARAADLFPTIAVDQTTGQVEITYHSASDNRRGWGLTHEHRVDISPDGQAMLITGLCGLRNVKHPECGGRQQFVFAVFVGDSGHIYTHRAAATKGWLTCPPEKICARLRKLGIGADRGVIQQGDYLLKPANGCTLPDTAFCHEYQGSGHHKFASPVLRALDEVRRSYQIRITEPTELIHSAIDGIQHPTIVVPPGTYLVGTTAAGLRHPNRRD